MATKKSVKKTVKTVTKKSPRKPRVREMILGVNIPLTNTNITPKPTSLEPWEASVLNSKNIMLASDTSQKYWSNLSIYNEIVDLDFSQLTLGQFAKYSRALAIEPILELVELAS